MTWTPQTVSAILTQVGTIVSALVVIVKLLETNRQQTISHNEFASKALDIANEPSTTNMGTPIAPVNPTMAATYLSPSEPININTSTLLPKNGPV